MVGTVKRLAASLLATFLCACGQSTSTPSPSPVGVDQWTIFGGGTGANPPRIAPDSSGRWGFTFPTPNKSVNYVITKPSAVPQAGQTMTLNFSIDGNAVLVPVPETACGAQGCGQAAIRMIVWRSGDNLSCAGAYVSYRLFSPDNFKLVTGDNQMFSEVLDPNKWINCYGSTDPAGFSATLSNIGYYGFMFGAMFAGHGVWAQSGTSTFKINAFAIK